MKLFVISPNVDTAFSADQQNQLRTIGDVVFMKTIVPLEDLAELYEGTEPRIIAVDPDFSDWKLPNEVVDKIPNLKAIVLQTTSFSWLDVDHCREKGIPVVNLRGFSAIAVSEWIVFMTFALARRLPIVYHDSWKLNYETHRGFELRGKTVGIIGLGNIGTAAAENFAGLGMQVQYWSPHSEDGRFSKVTLEELMRSSDVIVSAVAHNADTESLLSDNLVKSMKPGALFVDIAHPIYNTKLVLQLAAEGAIGGYAFEDEEGPVGKYEGNVWNGPALGWCTDESMSKNTVQWIDAMTLAMKGEYPTRVNA